MLRENPTNNITIQNSNNYCNPQICNPNPNYSNGATVSAEWLMTSDHSLSSDEDEKLVRKRDVKSMQRRLELEGYREGRARAQEAAIKVVRYCCRCGNGNPLPLFVYLLTQKCILRGSLVLTPPVC